MTTHSTTNEKAPRSRERWGSILRLVGLSSLLAATATATFYISVVPRDLPPALDYTRVVIGYVVLDWWGIQSTLFVLGIVSLIVSASLSQLHVRRGRVHLAIGTTVLIVAAVLGTGWVGFWEAFTDYRVVGESSEAGCKIVIREDLSGGEVGIVQPGSFLIDWASPPFYPDDFRSLTWKGDLAHITVSGEPGRPAGWYSEPVLRCLS